jgi:adenylyltransferase/sulfurtransferase
VIDLWDNRQRQVQLAGLREQTDCPTCKRHEFPWLTGERGSHAAILCGRNAVQLNPSAGGKIALEGLAEKLSAVGQVHRNPFLVRLNVDSYALTVFPDGRAIIAGTDDIATARSLYAKYIGN